MFTREFLSLDPSKVAQALETDGVFAVDQALTAETVQALTRDVEENRTGFNRNGITGVYYLHQFYLCHMLAVSRTFTELVTHPKILEITERVIGPEFRLKALRYYETYGQHHMQWHTDNKTDRSFAQIPGIIFIAYISDVQDGEFQYVKGSHRWSGEKAYNDYSDAFVDETLSRDVVSFKGRAGKLVIYDTYGIHRARPVQDVDFVRKSLFWQIDREISRAEPILLNPEFLTAPDSRLMRYLGFGLPTEYHRFPQTGIRTIASNRMAPDDLSYLQTEFSREARLELLGLRSYLKSMSVRDATKLFVLSLFRQLPPSLQESVKKRLGH
jgi:hypothetical protein